jgi:hypothetical protein
MSGEPITLRGKWDDAFDDGLRAAFGAQPERDCSIIADSHRFGQLNIYPRSYRFKAQIRHYVGGSEPAFGLQPVGPILNVRAEWWRLALWYACWPIRAWRRLQLSKES